MKHVFVVALVLAIGAYLAPDVALAASPFAGGTEALKSDLVVILTPAAAIGVLAVGAFCFFGKISWWWFLALIVGIVCVFGSDQIVAWIRGLFGV